MFVPVSYRHAWAHLPAAAEDEAGQESVRGCVRHRPGAADTRSPRGLGRSAGGGVEDRHLLFKASWICLLCSELSVLEPWRCGEKHGLYAAGPGSYQDSRYGETMNYNWMVWKRKPLQWLTYGLLLSQVTSRANAVLMGTLALHCSLKATTEKHWLTTGTSWYWPWSSRTEKYVCIQFKVLKKMTFIWR